MTIDPRIVFTILNVLVLFGVLGLVGWLGLRILHGGSRWTKLLLLPVLGLVCIFAALALATFPLSFSGSAESQQQIEIDR